MSKRIQFRLSQDNSAHAELLETLEAVADGDSMNQACLRLCLAYRAHAKGNPAVNRKLSPCDAVTTPPVAPLIDDGDGSFSPIKGPDPIEIDFSVF